MAQTVTVTSKGQLTLPARIRASLGIRKGTRLQVKVEDGEILLTPVRRLSEQQGLAKRALAKGGALAELRTLRQSWDREFERRVGEKS